MRWPAILALSGALGAQATPQVDGTTGVDSAYTTTPCSGPAFDPSDFTSSVAAWDPLDSRDWEFQFKVELNADFSCGTMATAYFIVTVTTNDTPANREANFTNVDDVHVYSNDVQYLVGPVAMTYDGTSNDGGHQWHYNWTLATVPPAATAYRMQAIIVGAGTSMITRAYRVSWQ